MPAVQAPRRALDPIGVAAQVKILQRLYFNLDADTAAKFSCAAAVRAQRVALVDQRIVKLLELDRRVFHVSLAHGNRCEGAVLERPAAPATAHNVLTDVS